MRQRQILIVEDNYLLLDLLTSLCERRGIDVMAASSGEAAVSAIRQAGSEPRHADLALLITDINLPGLIDGWSVAEAFRMLNPDLPVIYTSTGGCSDRRAVSGSIFLSKPFRIQDVVDLAAALMGSPSETRVPRTLPTRTLPPRALHATGWIRGAEQTRRY